jgi:hypothetical protein
MGEVRPPEREIQVALAAIPVAHLRLDGIFRQHHSEHDG